VQEVAVPAYTLRDDDPESLHAFVASLGRRDPKTVAALRAVVARLANPSPTAVSKPM
jgi:hypothetical protein